VHKSQGCEFPVVVIPVCGGPRLLLTRNLFYTALTRARSLVVLVGREQVIRDMVENNHIAHRYTALSDCLYQMSMSRSMKMPEDNA
jgi:exodeoxyribonuclease V alpha subunit